MATLAKVFCRLHRHNGNLKATKRCQQLIQSARCSMVAGSAQHTLNVRRKIDETKKKAFLGGGEKRIEKQHKKVCVHGCS